MKEELTMMAEDALKTKNGKKLYEAANLAIDENEEDSEAWLYLMKTFELMLPLEQCNALNEITCGRNAIEMSHPDNRDEITRKVYHFYLQRMMAVFQFGEQKLADAKEIASSYQRHYYFDAAHASSLTFKEDEPFIQAILSSFQYAFSLFDEIDGKWLKRDMSLSSFCEKLAFQWQRTYSYLEIRYEFYKKRLSDKSIEWGLKQYARLLEPVENKEEIIKKKVPFNLNGLNQEDYLK